MTALTDFEKFYKEKGEFHNLQFTLDRIRTAANEAGISDEIASKVVHIAGTNGKGSTSFFLEQILSARGQTTACFTSPHIHSITERIRLNGEEITADEFSNLFSSLKPLIEKHSLSYFEGLTLIAFSYFKANMPDTAIIETGLGGRLDSTNILNRKIPVITSISKDHTEYLGDDLLKIADEKLAIIKNNLLVFAGDNTEYMNKYLDYKLHTKTVVRASYSEQDYMGFSQPYANNLRLAESVADFIISGDMPENLKLPKCRCERIGQFILDGAHNEDALKKLAARFKNEKPVAVFDTTSDRDTGTLIKILEQFTSKIIVTSIPDFDRSIDPDSFTTSHIKERNPESALKIAVELSRNADILVCGSLYLCAHVREILTKG